MERDWADGSESGALRSRRNGLLRSTSSAVGSDFAPASLPRSCASRAATPSSSRVPTSESSRPRSSWTAQSRAVVRPAPTFPTRRSGCWRKARCRSPVFPQRTPGARSPKSRSQFPATVSDSAIRQILIWGWPIVTPAVTQLDRLRPLLHRPARPHRPAAGPHRPRLTGATRAHPGLDQALAAVRADDTLVVPKLDGLACSDPRRRSPGADARPCLLGPRGPGRRSRGSRCRRSEAVEAGCGTGVRRTPQGGT